VYGHTHECDDQTIGRTRIISNQLGYPGNLGGFECKDFDGAGLPVELGVYPERERKFPYESKPNESKPTCRAFCRKMDIPQVLATLLPTRGSPALVYLARRLALLHLSRIP
jgi:hypothetical protein